MPKYFQFYFIVLSLILCSSLVESGCSQISLTKKAKHSLIPETAGNGTTTIASQPGKTIDLSGSWTIGFRLRGATTAGTMCLEQNGQSFSGYGKDGESGPAFKIERGSIKANEIIFLKRYGNDSNPPVQYHGQFSYLSGDNGQAPYMGGDFSRETNGNVVTGDWEALKIQPIATNEEAVKEQPATPEAPTEQEAVPAVTNHIPDLSGKWRLAFEYNFKTVHSIMFLEQNGNHLNGHGVDQGTGSRFVIKNGWYNFPHLGFAREYVPAKKGNHALPGLEMTFKADVTLVNDQDYQGPYLSGKTQGGGSWEAERVN